MKRLMLVVTILFVGCSPRIKQVDAQRIRTKLVFENDIYYQSRVMATIARLAQDGRTDDILELTHLYFQDLPKRIAVLEQASGEVSRLREYDMSEEGFALKLMPEDEPGAEEGEGGIRIKRENR